MRASMTAKKNGAGSPSTSDPRLRSIQLLVRQAAEAAGLSPERVFDLTMATSEACANGIEHGGAAAGPAVVVKTAEGRLQVEVCSPRCFQIRATERSFPYDRGLGLPLMVSLTDEVSFARLPGGGTKVTLAVGT
jgi:serine/threonine-protein kinase RsbW